MFGATSTTGTSSSGFNFGASTATPAASGGFSFGASTAAPAASTSTGGFNFGGSTAAPAASTSTGGFNFGGSTAAPAASTSTGSFGFGATPATSTAAPAAGGFSFGGSTAAPAASTSTGGFGFGANTTTTAAAPAGGSSFSFGNTGTGSTAASGGFSFGGTSAPAATSSFGSTSGFGFGAAGAGAAGTKPSLFGQATTPATGGSSLFGGFGSSSAAPKPAGTGFGFGSSTTTPGFGGFGAAPAAGTGFGAAPAAAASTAPPPIILSAADASVAQLNTVKYAYQDPAQSRFKFLMYNQVDPTKRHLYVRPPHVSERLWTQAELDNPDPANLVPVPVVGFGDLLKRIEAQQTHADKLNKFTDDLRGQLKEMEKHTRATEEKLEKCRHEHVQLFHALVKVMKDIEFLQNLGKPLQREELDLATALKKLQTLLDAPGQYKARLNDVVTLQRVQQLPQGAPAAHHLTPDDLQRMYQFLDQQRQGLEHLTSVLQDDLEDIKLMKETWRR